MLNKQKKPSSDKILKHIIRVIFIKINFPQMCKKISCNKSQKDYLFSNTNLLFPNKNSIIKKWGNQFFEEFSPSWNPGIKYINNNPEVL